MQRKLTRNLGDVPKKKRKLSPFAFSLVLKMFLDSYFLSLSRFVLFSFSLTVQVAGICTGGISLCFN